MVINFKKLLNLEKQLVDCAKLKYEPIESLGFLASFKDPPKKLNRFVQGKYAKMNIFFRISSKKFQKFSSFFFIFCSLWLIVL